MKFLPAADDEPADKLLGYDFTEIARVLAQTDPRNDAYEALRGVLTKLSRHPSARRSPRG